MHAAVVTSFMAPPRYQTFPTPMPRPDSDEVMVDVLAAGLHPRVRSQASGSHYTSTDKLPLIPGVDGVGRGPDGALRYFVLADTTMGSMAEHTLVDLRRSVVLEEGTDPVAVAAAMNPAMSSWIALRRRVSFQPGQKVLVLGATGNAGRMAVQVAKRLGAATVIGAGRNPARLDELTALGATAVVRLTDDPAETAQRLADVGADLDVVLDYLWGAPTEAAMTALVSRRLDEARPLTWIEIGSVAGPTAAIPSAALRAVGLQLIGSGQGSVSARDIVAELPALVAEISGGTFAVNATPVPLAEVERAWAADARSDERIVLVP